MPKENLPKEDIPVTQGPVNQGPEDQGPEDQGPEDQRPEDQGPEDQGPEDQGPEDQGPEDQGPEDQGPEDQGPLDQGPVDQGFVEGRAAKAMPGSDMPPLLLDGFLPYRAARLANALSRRLAERYEARFEISVAEWRIIIHLTQESEISIRDIYTRVDMDRARVTRAVQRLQARGLVSKLVNESDRRLIRLALNDSGRQMANEIAAIAARFEAELLAAVPATAGEALLTHFDVLETALADMPAKLDANR
jgi:DNA-binding MarR family transcriptional regulator